MQDYLLLFFVGEILVFAEGAVFLLEEADMLAIAGCDKTGQVELGGGGENVARVGEGG